MVSGGGAAMAASLLHETTVTDRANTATMAPLVAMPLSRARMAAELLSTSSALPAAGNGA